MRGLLWKSDQPVAEATTHTKHNKYKGRTQMPLVGFEPAIPGSELPHTYAVDRQACLLVRQNSRLQVVNNIAAT